MIYDGGPWRQPDDWIDAIEAIVGITLTTSDVIESRDELLAAGLLRFDSVSRDYRLSDAAKSLTIERISAAEELERNVRDSWLIEVEADVAELPSDKLWTCLVNYAGRVFLRHGSDAAELLGVAPIFELSEREESAWSMLNASIEESGLSVEEYESVAKAVAIFFDGRNSDRVRYITELTDSVFSLLALEIDDETRTSLLQHLPELSVFVDTNVILGILGAHTSSLAAASADLLELTREQTLPFKFYYHEKTLAELERTMDALRAKLARARWTQAMSRALLGIPKIITSVEVRYHEINADIPTDPDVFLSRFSNLPELLKDYGLRIYRDTGSSQDTEARGQLVAEYGAYVEKNRPKNREKSYRTLDHDISIWLATVARQKPTRKGPLFAGSLVVSADFLFRRFDRDVLAPLYGNGTWVVTLPDVLLQALRPFVRSSPEFDITFSKIFAAPEFRGIGGDMADTINRVSAYLATYADLPEETATNLLTNSMLLSKLRDIGERTDEFRRLIDEHFVLENEALIQQRDRLQSASEETSAETVRQVESLREEIVQLRAQGSNGALSERIRNLERIADRLEDMPAVIIEKGGTYVNELSGGYYANDQSQVAAQGPDSRALGVSQQQDQRTIDVDLEDLSADLDTLKVHLLTAAQTPADYRSLAEIQAAKDASDKGEREAVEGHLRSAGKWALSAAKTVGLAVAEAAMKQALGLK